MDQINSIVSSELTLIILLIEWRSARVGIFSAVLALI